MDNFNVIYKILTALERSMDVPQFDISELNTTTLKVSTERLNRYLEMLQDADLVKGVNLKMSVTGDVYLENYSQIRITLKGLEYLSENTMMKRIYNAAKGIAELVP